MWCRWRIGFRRSEFNGAVAAYCLSVVPPWGNAPNLVSNLYRPVAHLLDNHGFHTRPRAGKVSSLGLRGE